MNSTPLEKPAVRPAAPIRVFLIDDQAMIRAAVRSLLAPNPRFQVIGDSGDPRAALEAMRSSAPDVVLLDITMPGLSGLDLLPQIRKALPKTKVLMLTHHEGKMFVDQALQEGAEGYLSKDSDPAELALAIDAVMRGDLYVSPRVAASLMRSVAGAGGPIDGHSRRGIGALTSREREVFQLLAVGKSNKEVAHVLGISLGTAKKHRENLQRKLACNSAAELARMAIREGLLAT